MTLACGGSGPATSDSPDADPPPDPFAGLPGGAGFVFDPTWPKPLPDNQTLGNVVGVAVDSRDFIWVLHRPGSLSQQEGGADDDPPLAECCRPAPPVVVFNQEGDLVEAWGGPGDGYEWPQSEHGIFIDHMDNVWLGGNGGDDAHVLKFTRDGQFLLQIGALGEGQGSNDTANFGQPAEIDVDPETNEVFVADGYGNRRVAVFDGDTGDYVRHWGAYGNAPTDDPYTYDPDAPPSQQFGRPVHCATLSDDGRLYVCDRVNNRIQVFERDGTYIDEVVMAPRTLDFGSAFDVDFSPDPDQEFLYNIDGMNAKIWVISRADLSIVDSFGFGGHQAGGFTAAHSLAVDSGGNIYVGETLEGKRVQRFVRR
ncbi:MAG: hypothetical protein F4W89_18115 [Acidobacteria bacterium]|nr:hypothetical protein [Acidobacteriota bacterium]